jgi:transposase-like protein
MAGRRREKRTQVVPPEQRYTIRDFRAEFPDDDTCLEWLKNRLYPDGIHCVKCNRVTKHHRVSARKSYSCQHCGHHVHPTSGTIFHKSSTPLTLWFHAIFVMSQTRCGISAKQLQREIGVTYKTAWRMFKQIRSMLAIDDNDTPLIGPLEADETYVGGVRKGKGKVGRPRADDPTKTAVFAMVERDGGRVVARVVPDTTSGTLMPIVTRYSFPGSLVYTDEYASYNDLIIRGYRHRRVHHRDKVYVGIDGASTNAAENFFSLVKGGIRGVYKHVGRAYLQSYLDEYAIRFNHRNTPAPMFKVFLRQIVRHAQAA